MPDLNYMAPYTSIGNVVQGVGNDMGAIALRVAQARYMNAIRQQQLMMEQQRMFDAQKNAAERLSIAQQTLRDRQALQSAQLPYYQAGTQQRSTDAAINQGKLDSADALARAVRGRVDLTQGPTYEGALGLNQGDIMENAARSMALSGKAGDLIYQELPPNYIAINPTMQSLVAQGMLHLSPGSIAQMPGGPMVEAPSYGNIPPGNIRKENKTGREVGRNDKAVGPSSLNLGSLYGSILGSYQDADPQVQSLVVQALQSQLQQMTNQPPGSVVGPPPGSPVAGGATNAPPTVPPPAPPLQSRVPGVYSTPKGIFRWTGSGWTTP